jgi:hypothetical protein
MHLYFSTNVGNPSSIAQLMHNWTVEPFTPGWYYFAGNYNLKANEKFSGVNLTGISTRLTWGQKLYPGQELFWTNVATTNINIGTRKIDDTAYITSVEINASKFTAGGSVGTDLATRYPSGYNHSNKKAVLRYNFGNHKLQWLNVHTDGIETLIAEANTAEDGNGVLITCSGTSAEPPAFAHRYYGWEYVHTRTQSPQPWRNWRIDRPAVNDTINGDTVLQYRLALIPGRYFQWTSTANDFVHTNGVWKSSNADTGLSNVEASSNFATFWEWAWLTQNTESIHSLHGMTHNTGNTYYASGAGGFWLDPDKGVTQIRLRYKSDNSVDIYDQTNSEVIATKDVDLGGEAFYLAFAFGAGITDTAKFHGGGDLITGAL